MIGVPCLISSTTSGAVRGMPGLLITSSALRISSAVCACPSSKGISYSSRIFLYLSLMGDISLKKTSKPFTFARTAAPVPLSPAPKIAILFIFYLIFNVMIAKAASIIVVIQKRTTIFDSCQLPFGHLANIILKSAGICPGSTLKVS